jgi:F-type H+-transporting ATPase subunit epsilon
VHSGFLEIMENKVRVLASAAEPVDEIDSKRAEEALGRANQRLSESSGGVDVGRALAAAMRAQARIECANQAGGGVRH